MCMKKSATQRKRLAAYTLKKHIHLMDDVMDKNDWRYEGSPVFEVFVRTYSEWATLAYPEQDYGA